MKIRYADSIEDLKTIGTIDEIVAKINHLVAPLKFEAKSYEEVLQAVYVLKEKWIDFIDGPFVSDEGKFLFLLTQMDGEKRNDLLGITDQHYEDKELARRWFKSIAGKIHPDKSSDKEGLAFKALQDLYNILTDYEEHAIDA
jgi:hypothetical protein